MEQESHRLRKAFSSNEEFFEFLEKEARSEQEAHPLSERGEHPSAEAIRDYVRGALSENDQKTVGDHIVLCESCTEKALEISFADEISTNMLKRFFSAFKENLSVFSFKHGLWWISGTGMAAACLLIFWLWPHSLSDQLNQSYQVLLSQELSSEASLPWEKSDSHLAFSAPDRDGPAYRAFGAGMWRGRQELFKEKKRPSMPAFLSPGWPDDPSVPLNQWAEMPEWAAYFQIGQWCFLMQAVCVSEIPVSDDFRDQQRELAEKLQKAFAEHATKTEEDARFVNDRLENIRSVLESPDWDSFTKRVRRIIAEEIESLSVHLSPRTRTTD